MTERTKGIILYAEDNDSIRSACERMIRAILPDFVPQIFEDGTSLEERLKEDVSDVRLVITDDTMPGISGSDIIRGYAKKEGFEQIPGARQSVSTEPVEFRDTEIVLETTNLNDLMKNGLQIFLIDETADELTAQLFFDRYNGIKGGLLYNLLKEGRFRWINEERNVNPSMQLKSEFSDLNQYKRSYPSVPSP